MSSFKKTQSRKSKRSSQKTSKSIQRMVDKAITKIAEVKHAEPRRISGTSIDQDITSSTLQVVPLMPSIGQGPGQGERVGNSVQLVKATLDLNIRASLLTGANVPPAYIDIYIFKFKKSNNQAALQMTNFLQFGNASAAYDSGANTFSGSLSINKDLFILKKHKRVLLYNPNNTVNFANRVQLLNAVQMKFDITKYYKKVQQWNDGTAQAFANDNLYMACGYSTNDGQNLGAVTYGFYDAQVQMSYTDI